MKAMKVGKHIICSTDSVQVLADIDVSDGYPSVEIGYITSRSGLNFYGRKEWDQFVKFIGELDEKIKGLSK